MRYIALLEFQPGLTATIMPPSSYLEKTNGTLIAENTRLIIDANGFMVSDRPLLDDHRKVLLLGGSSIENLYIREDQRVLAVLEGCLAEYDLGAKVYNAAISNAHLLHLINILLNKGLALRPDVVVWYPTSGVDVMANEVDGGFWNSADAMTPVRKAGKDIKIDLTFPLANKNGFRFEREMLRTMYDICANVGSQLVVATWPVYGEYDVFMATLEPNRAEFDASEVQLRALNGVVREVCAERGGTLVDLEAAVAGIHRPDHFYDRNHPNAKGCELIAEVTARAIRQALQSPANS